MPKKPRIRHEVRGLRIRGARGHPDVRSAYIRFGRWLREHRDFPTLLPVYLLPGEQVLTLDGRRCAASFFAPFSRRDAPYIRVATGDYPELRRARGRDNALAAFLHSFAHELLHYEQWVQGRSVSERGIKRRASELVRRYALDVDRP